MAEKEFVFKVKVVDESGNVVEKTAKNFKELQDGLKTLKSELENADFGSEKWNQLNEEIQKTENSISDATEKAEKMKETQKSLGDSLSAIPGPVGQVIQGVKGLGTAFKALIANPIGLVIAAIALALTTLYKAFTSTKAGAEKLEQIFAGISAALDVLRDRVLKVGGAIVKFFSGDFAGAADDIKGAFSGIGDEIAEEFNAARKIKAELQAITDATRELNKERAKQNTEIAKAKLVINDETKSIGERQEALEKVRQAEISLAKQEEILAQRRYEAIKAQNALSDSSKEALDEEAQAYITLQNAQLASLQKQKELFDQQKALRDKQRAEQKAAADKRKAELKSLADLENQLNLDLEKNATERAIKEAKLQEENQKKALKELNASAEQGQRILLKIVQQTQNKISDIEKEAEDRRITAFRESRARLQSLVLANDLALLEQLRKTSEKYLQEFYDEYENASKGALKDLRAIDEEQQQIRLDLVDETYKMLIDANNEYLADQQEIAKNERNLQLQNLRNLQIAEEQAIKDSAKAQIEAAQGNAVELANIEFNKVKQLEDLDARYAIERFETQKSYDLALVTNAQAAADREVEIQKSKQAAIEFSEAKIAEAKRASANLAIDALDTLAEAAGKETALGKALAIASTTISTYQAAQAAYASQFLIPTPDAPVRAGVAAAIAVAQGLLRVREIAQTNTEIKAAEGGIIGGYGSGTMDTIPVRVSPGEAVMNARSVKMFGNTLSIMNQLGGGARFNMGGITKAQTQVSPQTSLLNDLVGSSGAPIKTYVVSTDVSSQSQLDRQIRSRSVL